MNLPMTPLAEAVIRGAGGGKAGGSAKPPVEAPDSLRSIAYARILDLVSEGEIYGFADQANPLTCVYFNETPVQNPDGSFNFKNFHIDSRVGTQTQDPMEGFAGVESETGVGVRLEETQPWTRAFNNTNITAVRVRIGFPALSETDTSTGDVNGTYVYYQIELATDGGPFVSKLTAVVNGKCSSEYERSHRIELPKATTGWILRVTRITPESTSQALQNQTWIKSVTEIIDAKLRMPMSAYVGITIDSEQFNNIPVRAYKLRGRLLKIPSNYDPIARTYTGIWDGTFKIGWTNNPAWVFYDMATHPRYGLGHLVSETQVDKWYLYAIAQHCDQMVDDGFGGLEPRFTANVYRQTQEDATRTMMDLASIFRGMMYAAGGMIVPVGDMPSDAVYTYTTANVVDGKFTYSGSSRKVRHTVALVSWCDQNDFSRNKVEYVDDPESILRYGHQPVEVVAVGCTSRGQARRMGKYLLLTERFENDLVSFKVGLDGTIPAPGKIINIVDPLRAGRRTGGRIRTATLNSVTVDQMPLLEIGNTITVTMPAGGVVTRTVNGIADNTITVDTPFPQLPVSDSVWMVESPNLKAQKVRVLGITEEPNGVEHGIVAIRHYEGKFDAVEQDLIIEQPPVSDVLARVLMSPGNIVVTPRDVADENTTQKIINVSWSPVAGAKEYNVLYRLNNNSWFDAGNTTAHSLDIAGLQPGVLELQVTAIGANGVRSLPTYAGPFDIAPNAKPPKVIDTIQADVVENAQAIIAEQNARAQAILDETNARIADVEAEAQARADAVASEAQARADAILNEQLTREAAITNEQTVRQSADDSLAQSIATLAAGTGEQFDSKRVWYFDTDLESWTGSTGTSVGNGYVTPGASTTPYIQSPLLAGTVDGASYKYLKARIKKVGNPVWRGWLRWITETDTTYDTVKQVAIPEPTFDADGDATIDFKDVPWAVNLRQVRLYFTTTTDASNYVSADWIAIGRPAPGASIAALQDEATARINADSAEATSRQTLAAQMRGTYEGTDIAQVTQGLVFSERQARVSADNAEATARQALETTINDPNTGLAKAHSRITTEETTRANADTALSQRTATMEARMPAGTGTLGTAADITSEATARANADSANASQINVLSAAVDKVIANGGLAASFAPNALNEWSVTIGSTVEVSYPTDAAAMGGYVMRVGNNNGNDMQWARYGKTLAYNPNKLYRLRWRYRRVSGTGTVYLGLAGINAAKTLHVATTNVEVGGLASSHYTVSNASPALGTWVEGEAYFKGRTAGVAASNGMSVASPYQVAAMVAHVAPMYVANYNNASGEVEFDYLILEDAEVMRVDARVATEELARANADTALSQRTATVEARMPAGTDVLETKARVDTVDQARADGDAANATAIQNVDAKANTNAANITTVSRAVAAANDNGGVGLLDPGFERSDGWGGYGVLDTPSTNFPSGVFYQAGTTADYTHGGTKALRFAADGVVKSVGNNTWLRVTPGRKYRVTFWYRTWGTAPASGSYVRMSVRRWLPDGTGGTYSVGGGQVNFNGSTSVGYTKSSFIYTVPAGDGIHQWTVQALVNAGGGVILVDDVTVELIPEETMAMWSLTLDVNGYVSGMYSYNNGTLSSFTVLADKFAIVAPSGGARTEFSAGNWRVYDASNVLRVRMGVW